MSDDSHEYMWLDIVTQADPDYYKADEGVYEFTGNHKFDSTDKETTGIYEDS